MLNRAGYQNYRLKLKVLSPLFVGGGDDFNLTRLDYAFDPQEKIIYVLEPKKWMSFLQENNLLNDYTEEVSIKGEKLDNYRWLEKKRGSQANTILNQVKAYTISTAYADRFSNDLHGFIRNAEGEPFIPGSSIKGALRTALLSAFLLQDKTASVKFLKEVKDALAESKSPNGEKKSMLGRVASEAVSKVEKQFLNSPTKDEPQHFLSGLSVSDSTPFAAKDLVVLQKKDLAARDLETKELPIFREYASPGVEVEFTLTLDTFRLEKIGLTNLDFLMEALAAQFNLFFGQNGYYTAEENILSYVPKEALAAKGRGVLILGGGAGFHSKTVIRALASDNQKTTEITKKILDLSFHKHRHLNDRPFSPARIKIADYADDANDKKTELIIGFCLLSEVA